MWKLGLRPRYSQERNTQVGFSLQCGSVKTRGGEEKSFNKWRRKERGKREVGGGGDNAKEKGRYHPPV